MHYFRCEKARDQHTSSLCCQHHPDKQARQTGRVFRENGSGATESGGMARMVQ